MSMFEWLLVGHLVGDWLLQNQWMAEQKRKSWINAAIFAHCCVYTAAFAAAFRIGIPEPEGPASTVVAALVVFISHWLIDVSQLVDIWRRVLLQSDLSLVRMMTDQTFHVLILAALAYVYG